MRRFSTPTSLAALAAAVVAMWLVLHVRYNFGGRWEGTFCTGTAVSLPPELHASTYRSGGEGGYDGQFYRLIARDPWFRRGYAAYVDDARMRYSRILVPGLAWLLAGGRSDLADYSYILVVVLSVAGGVYWLSRFALLHGRSSMWGLVFVLMPGTLAGIDRMLVDGVLATWFAGLLLYCHTREWDKAYLVSALAALTRETGAFLAAGLVLFWLMQRNWKRAALFATACVPALAWYAFVRGNTVSSSMLLGNLSWPVIGYFQRLLTVRETPGQRIPGLVQTFDVVSLLGVMICTGLTFWWAWQKRRTLRAADIAALLFAAAALILVDAAYLEDPYAFGRPVTPMLLYVAASAIASRRFIALAPPLMMSASILLFFAVPVLHVMQALLR